MNRRTFLSLATAVVAPKPEIPSTMHPAFIPHSAQIGRWACRKTGKSDMYRMMAAKILQIDPTKVTPDQRKSAKNYFYHSLYSNRSAMFIGLEFQPSTPSPTERLGVHHANYADVLLDVAASYH